MGAGFYVYLNIKPAVGLVCFGGPVLWIALFLPGIFTG
jgi:hypothetical protein